MKFIIVFILSGFVLQVLAKVFSKLTGFDSIGLGFVAGVICVYLANWMVK